MRSQSKTDAPGSQQLELFAGLVAPVLAAPPAPRKRWSRKTRAVASPLFEQLAFDLRPPPVWVDPDDIPEEGDYPEHRWTRAADCEAPKTKAPASVWELGASFAAASVIADLRRARSSHATHAPEAHPVRHCRIVREGGVTRYIPMREQETEEWAEKERARRARQKLPKPPKQTFKLRKKEAA